MLTNAHILEPLLTDTARRFTTHASLVSDPVRIPWAYTDALDREVAGFIAAEMAFGRVAGFMKVLDTLFSRMGTHPAQDVTEATAKDADHWTHGLNHRFVRPEHLSALLMALGRVIREDGSLEKAFADGFTANHDAFDGLDALAVRIRTLAKDRDPGFLVPVAGRNSPHKRMAMFLRWMVRRNYPDFGIWRSATPAEIVQPMDVHVFRIAKFIGLLEPSRTGPNRAHARALTAVLKIIAPDDPVGFDFALSHLGISGACKGHYDQNACPECPLFAICLAAKDA